MAREHRCGGERHVDLDHCVAPAECHRPDLAEEPLDEPLAAVGVDIEYFLDGPRDLVAAESRQEGGEVAAVEKDERSGIPHVGQRYSCPISGRCAREPLVSTLWTLHGLRLPLIVGVELSEEAKAFDRTKPSCAVAPRSVIRATTTRYRTRWREQSIFYYYGAKNQLARYYPPPEWGVVIEPFAGSAAYSQYWRSTIREAILVDKDERTVELWHQLQRMNPEQILALPTPVPGEYYEGIIDSLIKMAAASNGVSAMTGPLACPKRVAGVWEGMMRRMAARVDDVRNWTVLHGDYTEALAHVERSKKFPPGSRFTWFVDPPYSCSSPVRASKTAFPLGHGYREGSSGLDYALLAEWTYTLPGHVVVCEQAGADWLAGFRPLRVHHDSQGGSSGEVYASWSLVAGDVRRCSRCCQPIAGRADARFCSTRCRVAAHRAGRSSGLS